MRRLTFLLLGAVLPLSLAAGDARILVQRSPLAGAQYHGLDTVLPELRPDDVLELVREPDNPFDAHAVRVAWRGHKLGYLPRAQNRILAAAMDAGERVEARIGAVTPDANPWRRLRIDVWLVSGDTP